MCKICIDYLKGNLTAKEAQRNLNEAVLSDALPLTHIEEVLQLIEEEDNESTR